MSNSPSDASSCCRRSPPKGPYRSREGRPGPRFVAQTPCLSGSPPTGNGEHIEQGWISPEEITNEPLRIVVLLVATMLIPLGTVYAYGGKTKTDDGHTKVWTELQAAVKAGKISAEDAKAKWVAIIKKAKINAKNIDQRFVQMLGAGFW